MAHRLRVPYLSFDKLQDGKWDISEDETYLPKNPKVLVIDDRIGLINPAGEVEAKGNEKPIRVTLEQAQNIPGMVAIFSMFADKDIVQDKDVIHAIKF